MCKVPLQQIRANPKLRWRDLRPAPTRLRCATADDLHKRYIDKRFLALTEDYEVQKFERDVKAQKPRASSANIDSAVLECAKTLPSNHARAQWIACSASCRRAQFETHPPLYD